jgi:alpha-tubulin suppressor-like RCC1 family protein
MTGRASCCAVLAALVAFGCRTTRRPESGTTPRSGETDAGDAAAEAAVPSTGAGPGPVLATLPGGPQLGAGAMFTCFLHPDGRVLCWGDNIFGVLGDGTETDRASPVAVRGLDHADLLAVDANGACARRADGRVLCWGYLGPATGGSPEPSAVAGLDGVVRLLLLYDSICGLTPGGDVLCRGRNEDLSTGEATRVEGASGAVELGGGGRNACVRRGDGAVRCWGDNAYGQLGDRTTNASASAVPVSGVADAVALWSVGSTTWARRADGSLWVWGADATRDVLDQGALPRGPEPVDDPSGVLARAAELHFRCVRTTDGEVWCRKPVSETGTALSAGLERVGFPAPVRALAVGGLHACGVDDAGAVRCFGDNADGQLGLGDSAESVARPTPVAGVDDATRIVVGEWDGCALRRSGKVVCWHMPWGADPPPAPAEVAGISGAVALHSGGQYACAIDRGGTTRCWGRATWRPCLWESDDNCQAEDWGSPRRVEGLADVEGGVEVVGDCVRTLEGSVRCVTRYAGEPVWTVQGVSDAVGLAGGAWLRCILRGNRQVACVWPRAGAESEARAEELAGASDVVSLAASGTHVCVVHEGGGVSCSEAPLRPGESCDSAADACAALRPVEGLVDAVEVVAGNGFSCVRHRDGGVSCWGGGGRGVLGNGATDDAPAPVRVADLADVVQLAAREDHVCARRRDGQVLCWGRILPGTAASADPAAEVRMPAAASAPSPTAGPANRDSLGPAVPRRSNEPANG